jgi:hypothetical protein
MILFFTPAHPGNRIIFTNRERGEINLLFYRQSKNKSPKGKYTQSGQIFPVLLICIAGLLAAVVVTRNVGEANIAKTCSSNAADAGSLSAASCMTAAFNRLVYRNWNSISKEAFMANGVGHGGRFLGHPPKAYFEYYYYKEMRKYFEEMRGQYELLYMRSDYYLNEAFTFLKDAIDKLIEAKAIVDGLKPLECLSGSPCGVEWTQLVTSAQPLISGAADDINSAALNVGAFNALAAYKGNGQGCSWDPGSGSISCNGPLYQGLTFWFRQNQIDNACGALGYIIEARGAALATGQQIALQNSCYTDKLSDAQRDDYNFWMDGGADGGAFNSGGGATVSYTPKGGGCSIDVTLEIPTADIYTIRIPKWHFPQDPGNRVRHSLAVTCYGCDDFIGLNQDGFYNDPFDYKISKRLTNDLISDIQIFIRALAVRCNTIYQLTKQGAACCCCSCGGDYSGCGNCDDCGECCKDDNSTVPPGCLKEYHASCDYDLLFVEAERQRKCLSTNIGCILGPLNRLISEGQPLGSIPALKDWNQKIMDNVWTGDLYPKKKDCASISSYKEDNKFFPGMMIKNLHDVTLSDEEWKTRCQAVSSCGATSESKSKFCGEGWPCGGKGDLIGKFRDIFYPEIIETN